VAPPPYPVTPDGRYFLVRGRLWRMSDPSLDANEREELVRELMRARAALGRARRARKRTAGKRACARIEATKVALGERGAVWWSDGAPDYNRHMARTTPYAEWFERLSLEGAAGPRRRSRAT
jgi:hypothetical protein